MSRLSILSVLEQDILLQLKTKAKELMKQKVKTFSINMLFKSKETAYVNYITVKAYTKIAEIDRTFEKLVETFRGDSGIINFDVETVDKIPPVPISQLSPIKTIEREVNALARDAYDEISKSLSPKFRGKKGQMTLIGPVISIAARVVVDSIIYDLSSEDDIAKAIPLARFMYRKALSIGGSLVKFSISRIMDLKVMKVVQGEDFTEVYVQRL